MTHYGCNIFSFYITTLSSEFSLLACQLFPYFFIYTPNKGNPVGSTHLLMIGNIRSFSSYFNFICFSLETKKNPLSSYFHLATIKSFSFSPHPLCSKEQCLLCSHPSLSLISHPIEIRLPLLLDSWNCWHLGNSSLLIVISSRNFFSSCFTAFSSTFDIHANFLLQVYSSLGFCEPTLMWCCL